ncbi:MAG: hypothetical protein PHE09_18080 [Oscillospiraceae bacterium]|nr:hypothetical protein [Oscillospiraceae bacterium]
MSTRMKKVIFSCGHEGYINYYNAKERKDKEEWAAESGLCPKCFRAEQEKRRQKTAAINAAESDLPELTGSEKQIKWAMEIRDETWQKIKMAEKGLNSLSHALTDEEKERCNSQRDDAMNMIAEMTTAHWWIENRDYADDGQKMLELYYATIKKQDEKMSKTAESDAKEEMTLSPTKVSHQGTVEVKALNDSVSVYYQRNDDFRKIVKRFGFRWDTDAKCWTRKCNKFTGTASERAAELINALLTNGFRVLCIDNDIRLAAVNATFMPEQKRWIVVPARPDKNMLWIKWEYGNDELYESARSLPGAHWNKNAGSMEVPVRNWREVIDFADLNSFSISSGAQAAIDSMRESIVVNPSKVARTHTDTQSEKLDAIMQNADIPEDLRDD